MIIGQNTPRQIWQFLEWLYVALRISYRNTPEITVTDKKEFQDWLDITWEQANQISLPKELTEQERTAIAEELSALTKQQIVDRFAGRGTTRTTLNSLNKAGLIEYIIDTFRSAQEW